MVNLINRDLEVQSLCMFAKTLDPDRSNPAFMRAGVLLLAELLAMAPAEPDAEIVVRCRGCKYYTPINGAVGTCELPGGMQRPPSDGYCSRGVRRKGQDADDKDKEGENNG